MAAVADLERLLERVFERTSARLFRSRVQPLQVERHIERAMEASRTGRGAATAVPDRYRVRLHPADLDDLVARDGSLESLSADMAGLLLAFARQHGYHLSARPSVSLAADPIVERRTVEVDASVGRPAGPDPWREALGPVGGSPLAARAAGLSEAASAAGPPGARLATGVVPPAPAAETRDDDADLAALVAAASAHGVSGARRRSGAPLRAASGNWAAARPGDAPIPSAPTPLGPDAASGLRTADEAPHQLRPVASPSALALLRVTEPGGLEREVRVGGPALTLGRAPDNGLVLADARVSRHHGRFQERRGTLVYTDLGSTNGTRVNGVRVDEIVLGAGDRLQLGDVVVIVEQLPR